MEETLNPKVLWVVGRKGGDAELAGGKCVGQGSLAGECMIRARQDPSMGSTLSSLSHSEPISQRAYLTASFVVDSLVRANRLEQDKTPVFFFMHRVLSW